MIEGGITSCSGVSAANRERRCEESLSQQQFSRARLASGVHQIGASNLFSTLYTTYILVLPHTRRSEALDLWTFWKSLCSATSTTLTPCAGSEIYYAIVPAAYRLAASGHALQLGPFVGRASQVTSSKKKNTRPRHVAMPRETGHGARSPAPA